MRSDVTKYLIVFYNYKLFNSVQDVFTLLSLNIMQFNEKCPLISNHIVLLGRQTLILCDKRTKRNKLSAERDYESFQIYFYIKPQFVNYLICELLHTLNPAVQRNFANCKLVYCSHSGSVMMFSAIKSEICQVLNCLYDDLANRAWVLHSISEGVNNPIFPCS